MAKKAYIGVDGVAQKVKKAYIGVEQAGSYTLKSSGVQEFEDGSTCV